MSDAMRKHPEVDVLINFASLRSAYDSTIETMNFPQVSGESAEVQAVEDAQANNTRETLF